MIRLRFQLPWDFASVATVINNYAVIRIKWKCHIDAIANEVDFHKGDNVPCLQTSVMTAIIIFLWRLVWSKFSMLPGTAATCVWVIWLYNQNTNIITYTRTPLTLYPGGWWWQRRWLLLYSPCSSLGHLPTLAALCFYAEVLPHCGAGNGSSSNIN